MTIHEKWFAGQPAETSAGVGGSLPFALLPPDHPSTPPEPPQAPQRPLPSPRDALERLAWLVTDIPAARSKVATLKHGREVLKERIVGREYHFVNLGLEGANETARMAYLGQKLADDNKSQGWRAQLEKDELEIIAQEAALEILEREWSFLKLLVQWETAREAAHADQP